MIPQELRVEPYEQTVSDRDARPTTWTQVFWKLSIPGRILSDRAHPFGAADRELILNECTQCGRCGLPDVMVRRVGPTVCWIDDPNGASNDRSLQPDEIIVFDADQYDEAVGSGCVMDLVPIQQVELRSFLSCLRFPLPEKAIYRIPEIANDPLGQRSATLIRDAIATSLDDVRIESQPDHYIRLRIGFDLPNFPECQWEIGRNVNGIAVLLREYPCFPVWLGSHRLDEIDNLGTTLFV